jgi:hypothetical protein
MEERGGGRECGPFTIREMEVEDIPGVFQLGAETFTADQWPMLYRSWDEYEVTSLFNTDGEYCLVAEADEEEGPGRLCGCWGRSSRSRAPRGPTAT